jgi:hypothetical protein
MALLFLEFLSLKVWRKTLIYITGVALVKAQKLT